MFKIGSLFDGSGGFPLAAFMCGGVPVWASEVEPYPIAVTKTRFPHMKHLGSVTDVRGDQVEPVELITFGSPCQDLSVAGKRAGLKHTENGDEETTRSGLFMEAVRIIREMREATNGVYPRFALWENVPGAFSSNKGEDFRIVLEELIKIVEPEAVMPAVPKAGWSYADHYCGDGWSLAYRTLDSQYWGVPQRRNRIHLVLDLGGQCAGEVLFEREGLRGYFAEGRTPWESPAGDATSGTRTADRESEGNCVAFSFDSLSSNSMKSSNPYSGCRQVEVAKTLDCFDPSPAKNQGGIAVVEQIPYTMKIRSGCEGGGKGPLIQEDMSATLSTLNDQYLFQPVVLNDQGGSQILVSTDGISPTLRAESHGHPPCVMESAGFKELNSAKARSDAYEYEMAPCLSANKHDASVCVKCYDIGEARLRTPSEYVELSPTITARCGTGGNNVPAVVYDARGNGDGYIAPTITGDHNNRVTDYTTVVCCIDGDKIGKAERAGGSGLGIRAGDKMYTLTSKDAGSHAVCYANTYQKVTGPLMANSHPGSYCGQDAYSDMLVVGEEQAVCYRQGGFADYVEGEVGTLRAAGGDFGGGSENLIRIQYIVRRLTPTECARLQGFPDGWGHPDPKTSFTDEDYEFWLNVRNTHAAINGKAVKNYTREQMLTWYNKLHTDSSEYKMWGNGIALPTALYVMQGIADVFK